MADDEEKKLRTAIRNYILFFMIVIIMNGISAFAIEPGLAVVYAHIDTFPFFMRDWLSKAYSAVKDTNEGYPFLAYGTDWLAFSHLIIAILFIGPLLDPVKNIWVIQWGMIACICAFPLAFIAGSIRGIPYYWQLLDCVIAAVGLVSLYICYKKIGKLEAIPHRRQ